ncbi:MAG: ABC transporter substrate-binding protein [Candidatus Brocadiia bacterium]
MTRQVLFAVLLGACLSVGLLAAGCEPAGEAPPAETLDVGIGTDVEHWSPREFPGGDARFVWCQVFETLVRLTPELELEPGLALSWHPSDGGRTWEFRLRPGVRFHNGEPFTAEAVAFSYGPESYSRGTILRAVRSVEVVDPETVRFHLRRPMPLPQYLTHIGWPVMSPDCLDAEGRVERPIGTGPFRFESHAKGEEIVLRRNPDYRGGPGEVERVVFRIIPDAAARLIALQAGELDMAVKVPDADVPRLEEHPGIQVHRTLSTFTDFVQFNCRRGPFSDPRMRRAVAQAVDTDALVRELLAGVGQPAEGRPLSPVMHYTDVDLDPIRYDPGPARALLEEAGWMDADGDGVAERDGEPLRVRLLVTQNPNVGAGGRFPIIAEALQAALGRVGMKVGVQMLESGAFLRAEKEGEFDMLLRTGYYVWGGYPRHFFLHHSANPFSHFGNEEFDRLVEEADAAPDETTRRELYHRLQRETMRLLPAFYMVHREKVVAARRNVAGYPISAEGPWLELRSVTLE